MVQGYNYIARAALALNDNRRADLAIRKSLTLDGKRSETHLLLGYLRVQEKKFDEALVSFKRSSELDRSDTVSLCMIGYVLEKTGKSDQALPYYSKALQLHPNDEMASKMIATIDSREE